MGMRRVNQSRRGPVTTPVKCINVSDKAIKIHWVEPGGGSVHRHDVEPHGVVDIPACYANQKYTLRSISKHLALATHPQLEELKKQAEADEPVVSEIKKVETMDPFPDPVGDLPPPPDQAAPSVPKKYKKKTSKKA